MVYIHSGVLVIYKEHNYVICRKINETRVHHIKCNQPNTERQISHFLLYMETGIKKRKTT
jgi:hypothetical protein